MSGVSGGVAGGGGAIRSPALTIITQLTCRNIHRGPRGCARSQGSVAMSFIDHNDQTGNTMDCPTCGSVMASYQAMDGAFFICGGCGLELPTTEDGTLEE